MIIKSNNNVFKNYFGNENVNKVYAGENLVFGNEYQKPETPTGPTTIVINPFDIWDVVHFNPIT